MPRFVISGEVLPFSVRGVLVDSVVGILQFEGGEMGEYVDEYLFRKLEYYGVTSESKVRFFQASA